MLRTQPPTAPLPNRRCELAGQDDVLAPGGPIQLGSPTLAPGLSLSSVCTGSTRVGDSSSARGCCRFPRGTFIPVTRFGEGPHGLLRRGRNGRLHPDRESSRHLKNVTRDRTLELWTALAAGDLALLERCVRRRKPEFGVRVGRGFASASSVSNSKLNASPIIVKDLYGIAAFP